MAEGGDSVLYSYQRSLGLVEPCLYASSNLPSLYTFLIVLGSQTKSSRYIHSAIPQNVDVFKVARHAMITGALLNGGELANRQTIQFEDEEDLPEEEVNRTDVK